jgi:phage FluMu protein Com
MPIRFRCSYCNRLLGIATRKAGTETVCPHCGYTITVPVPQSDEETTQRINLDDVEELIGRAATERIAEPATQRLEAPVVAPPVSPPPAPPALPEVAKPAIPHVAKPSVSAPPADVAPKPRPVPPPIPKSPPKKKDENSLFEGDIDELLGGPVLLKEDDRPKPPPVSGVDALSLGDSPKQIVMSAQKATLLMVGVVVLMALAFAAGYWLAPKS